MTSATKTDLIETAIKKTGLDSVVIQVSVVEVTLDILDIPRIPNYIFLPFWLITSLVTAGIHSFVAPYPLILSTSASFYGLRSTYSIYLESPLYGLQPSVRPHTLNPPKFSFWY